MFVLSGTQSPLCFDAQCHPSETGSIVNAFRFPTHLCQSAEFAGGRRFALLFVPVMSIEEDCTYEFVAGGLRSGFDVRNPGANVSS